MDAPPALTPHDWLAEPALALAARIRDGSLTAEAAVGAALARIASVNPAINAVVSRCDEAAMQEAAAADRAREAGQLMGPLHGVPITIKDSFDTAGVVTTAGTQGRAAFVPSSDATVVARLKAAGAIVIGKTNTPELTLAYEADNLVYGRTRNPYDRARGTGGSSGGSAAIVAACGSALDIGSDTAGSIRFPAHCCGVAGLKPTSGRVPRTGHVIGPGGLQQSLTTIGPIARHVEDLEAVLRIIAGPDDGDPHVVPVPLRASGGVDLHGLRAAVFTDTRLAAAAPDVRRAVLDAAAVLARAGVELEAIEIPEIERAFEFFPRLFGADGAAGLEGYLAALGTTTISPQVQGAIALMRREAMSSAALGDLCLEIDAWRARMLAFVRRHDLIVCPPAADEAPLPVADWMDPSVAWNARVFPYLVPFNFTGAPAVVVRAGTATSGLPLGVQLVAAPWREDVALRAAAEIERALGGWQAPPGR